MKKLSVLICLSFFLTGCTVSKVDLDSKEKALEIALNKDIELFNRVSIGYKYYLPRGMTIIDYENYNEVLYSNTTTYYLYVDITSYHYKKEKQYEIDNSKQYSKILNYDGKTGYLEIDKQNDKYYILYEYNYAKIEAIVKEKNINEAILNMSYILSSIKYNDVVIKNIIGENVLDFKEEKYTIKKPKQNDKTFLDYVNIYDKYNDEEEIEDTDTIKQNNETLEEVTK